MNAMERVTAMLSHKEVDRIPVYPILSGVTRKLVGATYEEWATNADVCADALYKAVKQFDLDGVVTLIDLSVECDAWGQKLIFHENDAPHPDYSQSVIQDIEDYAKIKKADYKQSKRMMMHIEVCRQLVEKANGEFPVTAFVFGPLGTLSMLRNQEDMYNYSITTSFELGKLLPEKLHFTAPICVSDPFLGWVCGFGGKVTITAPAEVRAQMASLARALADTYGRGK